MEHWSGSASQDGPCDSGNSPFEYCEKGSLSPFPSGPSLRCMEEKLLEDLGLPSGSLILDAGCRVAHVAI